ncbi:hypothetical protein GY45DRAFT_1377719 [Cubamyces sp. BRFM 1775]|nr:hypothetical protein GY45DRAFT_1377719 [Cubamyces sp. BRFM 1775]
MDVVDLYIKKRGEAPVDTRRRESRRNIILGDATIPPPTPLKLGRNVHLYTIEEYHHPYPTYTQGITQYIAEDTEVRGTVVHVRMVEKGTVDVVVRNSNEQSRTKFAYITIPYTANVTIALDGWRWILYHVAQPLLAETRKIALEGNVVIHHDPIIVWDRQGSQEDGWEEQEDWSEEEAAPPYNQNGN